MYFNVFINKLTISHLQIWNYIKHDTQNGHSQTVLKLRYCVVLSHCLPKSHARALNTFTTSGVQRDANSWLAGGHRPPVEGAEGRPHLAAVQWALQPWLCLAMYSVNPEPWPADLTSSLDPTALADPLHLSCSHTFSGRWMFFSPEWPFLRFS